MTRRRQITEAAARISTATAAALCAMPLLFIMGIVLVKGWPHINLQMLTRIPSGGYYLGGEGGILNAILGTLCVGAGATVVAFTVSLPVVVHIHFYSHPEAPLARTVRFCMDLLWGIPSIVYGAVGFAVMVLLGMKASLGAAILTVSLLEIPILVRAMDEALAGVPAELNEASLGLGATRWQTARRVALRQAFPGLLTAIILAFGRGTGDTAAVLFTAGFTDALPTSLAQPVATLPLAVFFQLGSPFPEVQGRAYASALVLTLMLLVFSMVSRWATSRRERALVR